MNGLTYNETFDMHKTGDEPLIFKLMDTMKPMVGTLICVPWLFNLIHSFPWIKRERMKWIAFCAERVEKRKKVRADPSP